MQGCGRARLKSVARRLRNYCEGGKGTLTPRRRRAAFAPRGRGRQNGATSPGRCVPPLLVTRSCPLGGDEGRLRKLPRTEEGGMRRVGPNSFCEIYFAGCNPSFVDTSDGYVMIDTPQQPIDAVRWRERMEEKAPIRYLFSSEPHGDPISGNAYFPNVKVVGQVKLQECFERYLYAF